MNQNHNQVTFGELKNSGDAKASAPMSFTPNLSLSIDLQHMSPKQINSFIQALQSAGGHLEPAIQQCIMLSNLFKNSQSTPAAMLQKRDMTSDVESPGQGPQLESKSKTSAAPPADGPFKIIKTPPAQHMKKSEELVKQLDQKYYLRNAVKYAAKGQDGKVESFIKNQHPILGSTEIKCTNIKADNLLVQNFVEEPKNECELDHKISKEFLKNEQKYESTKDGIKKLIDYPVYHKMKNHFKNMPLGEKKEEKLLLMKNDQNQMIYKKELCHKFGRKDEFDNDYKNERTLSPEEHNFTFQNKQKGEDLLKSFKVCKNAQEFSSLKLLKNSKLESNLVLQQNLRNSNFSNNNQSPEFQSTHQKLGKTEKLAKSENLLKNEGKENRIKNEKETGKYTNMKIETRAQVQKKQEARSSKKEAKMEFERSKQIKRETQEATRYLQTEQMVQRKLFGKVVEPDQNMASSLIHQKLDHSPVLMLQNPSAGSYNRRAQKQQAKIGRCFNSYSLIKNDEVKKEEVAHNSDAQSVQSVSSGGINDNDEASMNDAKYGHEESLPQIQFENHNNVQGLENELNQSPDSDYELIRKRSRRSLNLAGSKRRIRAISEDSHEESEVDDLKDKLREGKGAIKKDDEQIALETNPYKYYCRKLRIQEVLASKIDQDDNFVTPNQITDREIQQKKLLLQAPKKHEDDDSQIPMKIQSDSEAPLTELNHFENNGNREHACNGDTASEASSSKISDSIFDANSRPSSGPEGQDDEDEENGEDSSDSTVIECICNGQNDTDHEFVIACDLCHKWFHRKCTGLLIRQWKFFQKNQDFQWFCQFCREAMKDGSVKNIIERSLEQSHLASFQNSRVNSMRSENKEDTADAAQKHQDAQKKLERRNLRLQKLYTEVEREQDSFKKMIHQQIDRKISKFNIQLSQLQAQSQAPSNDQLEPQINSKQPKLQKIQTRTSRNRSKSRRMYQDD